MDGLITFLFHVVFKDLILSRDIPIQDGIHHVTSCAKLCMLPCISVFFHQEKTQCVLVDTIYEASNYDLSTEAGRKYYIWHRDRFISHQTPPVGQRKTFFTMGQTALDDTSHNSSTLLFLVRRCTDAIIQLHTQYDKPTRHFIGAGKGCYKNSIYMFIQACLRCPILKCHPESNILSCNEFRPFWVSWRDGTFSVGKGLVAGERTIMRLIPPHSTLVKYISVYDYHIRASWHFLKQSEQCEQLKVIVRSNRNEHWENLYYVLKK